MFSLGSGTAWTQVEPALEELSVLKPWGVGRAMTAIFDRVVTVKMIRANSAWALQEGI